MEGIGGRDLVGDGFGATIRHFGFAGLLQSLAVRSGDVGSLGGVGKRFEEALAENVVNLIGGKVHRRDVALLAAQLLPGILQGPVDESGAGVIGRGKIRNHHANIILLAGSGQ